MHDNAYSADGTRLFSCGTREGEPYLVEWNENDGAIKRVYNGLWKRSVGVVQFDTMQNRFLATGDEFQIKFWDMDKVDILTTTAAKVGLLASPCIQFNKLMPPEDRRLIVHDGNFFERYVVCKVHEVEDAFSSPY
ncbi:hypothetical protein CMV_011330 [Castanea mollissima]|uniref:Uncharacterized protein n=1 Tax=Castanea mollissima TaxID=60419 RepID=A0A8J4VX06_9ROSI|nr:hypothetical protein CMV_011330 [Castanea mollissima]